MNTNPFKYSDDNKRYHTFNYYLRHTYNQKVSKIPLDAGFTCPNRDGKCGVGGCTFCSSSGSGEFTRPELSILEQYAANKTMMQRKWPNCLTIPYFQAYTNTYGPLTKIKEMITPFIDNPEVCAIALATRADCLEEDVVNYLDSLTAKKDIWIELGLQTANDSTASKLNRGHSYDDYKKAIHRLKQTNLKICTHIMNGLPGETIDDMIDTAQKVSNLKVDAIKIHMLYIAKDTVLAKQYLESPFAVLTKEEYVDIVIKQLELIDPTIIIERLTGDPVKQDCIAPTWLLNKTDVLNTIDKEMVKRNTYQGIRKGAI